jgi:signal transduction histidine kinase
MEYRFRGRLLWILHPSRTNAGVTLLLGALLLVAAPSFCAAPSRPVEQPVKLSMLFYGDGGKGSPALVGCAPSQNMFDWRQMNRWGIAMDVPAGSMVINEDNTVWELYKWRIVGLFGLVIVEALLLVVLIRLALEQRRHVKQLARQNAGSGGDLTERKHAEDALRQSEELKASILGSLSNHVVVVDAMGIVVDVNDPGLDFGAGAPLLHIREGVNYFDMCRSATGGNTLEGAAALDGIQAVFDRKRDDFEMEYVVHSAPGQPCLLMSVTVLKGHDHGVVISHQDITERKPHEQAIQDLSGRLIKAQEEERSRIARELHDDINQQVAMLAIELQQLQGFLPAGFPEGREKVQALWEKTHILSTEIQHLSHQLHSAKLEHLGIIAALRGLCSEFSEQHKVEADFQYRQVPPNLDSNISLTLFRVAQESLHNIAKHSHATKVRLELVGTANKIVLRVSDDGVGFATDRHRTGLGMISMNERTRLVGGTFAVSSIPSLGTQVEASISLSTKTTVGHAPRLVQTNRKTG